MRASKAWQKVSAAFKKPFQKLFAPKKPITKTEHEKILMGGPGKTSYGLSHMPSPTAFKRRKRRKRMENKSRAVNYQKNKKS